MTLTIDKQSGKGVQKSCFGNVDHKWIAVRTTVATVPSTETLQTAHDPLGLLDVSKFSQMSILLDYSPGSPGLTSTNLFIRYTDINNTIIAKPTTLLAALDGTSIALLVNRYEFQITVTGNYLFTVPLPPAKYAKFYVDSTGTVTLSQLQIYVGLGWGSDGFQQVNKA